MSTYLNFYLVPKKEKIKYEYNEETKSYDKETIKISNGDPLWLMSYGGCSDIYAAFNESLEIEHCYKEVKYTDLTCNEMSKVIEDFEDDVKRTEERLEINYKILKTSYDTQIIEEIFSFENYLKEQKETLSTLKVLASIIYNIYENSEFEKVLININ